MIWYNRLSQSQLFSVSEEINFSDLVDDIALKKTIMYMGNGIEFKHKEEKYHKQWHKIDKRNKFYEVMFMAERLMGRNGVCFLILNKNEEGKSLITFANPFYSQFANKCFANSTQARVYAAFIVDNKVNNIRCYYDTEKTEYYLVDAQDNIETKIDEFVSKLPKKYQVYMGKYNKEKGCYVYYHNLGFVPVCIMTNQPLPATFFPYITNSRLYTSFLDTTRNKRNCHFTYESLSNTANCSGEIEMYETLRTLQVQNAIIDKTRAITYGITEAEKNRNGGDNKDQSWLLNNCILDAGYGNSAGGPLQNGSAINILKPSNNLTNYDDTISNLLREIYRKSGLSFLTQTSTQKTSSESFSQYKESLETLYFMQQHHTSQWKDVIIKMFQIEGVDADKWDEKDWSFQVKRNTIIDEANKIDNFIKKIQAGSETPVSFISADKHVDEDQAQQIWETNKQWFKKNNYQIQMQDGQKSASGVGTKPAQLQSEKGGRPTNNGGK